MNLFIYIADASQAQTSTPTAETEISCSIERMIDFGAHSREFIGFIFALKKEGLLRNAIAKLVKNGMNLEVLLDYEKRTIKDKMPEEKRDIINGYINSMSDLVRPEEKELYLKTSPYRFCADLILSAGLDEDAEEYLILSSLHRAKDLLQMDGSTCAEYLFSYRHRNDVDADLELYEGYTPYVEEVERICELYFPDDYDDEYEFHDYDDEEEY